MIDLGSSARSRPRTVTVAGATGKQGGAVARALLSRGHRVIALARRPDAPAADALRTAGAHVMKADFSDPHSLRAAMTGAEAVFAVGVPWGPGGPEAETREGIAIVDAAVDIGVEHLIYSSIASGDRRTGIPFFESKRLVESAVVRSGIPWTIVGPVFFMENIDGRLLAPFIPKGIVAMPLPPQRHLQQVAVADIGRFVVEAIEHPDRYAGRRIDVASDELSGEEMARALEAASGRPFRYQQLALTDLHVAIPGYREMFAFLARTGYQADIAALRAEAPEVGWQRYAEWARTQRC
jgi:uncharacterized protein YbjT (DUF2867 family)